MADPRLRQSGRNGVCRGQAREVTVTLTAPTAANNLVVVVAVGSDDDLRFSSLSGFTRVTERWRNDLAITVWYREACPVLSAVTVRFDRNANVQLQVLEYDGIAQANALDRVSVQLSTSRDCRTGSTGITAQADELVVAIVANRYASTRQSAFTGGLVKLLESLSPERWGFLGLNADPDERRTVLTIHQVVARQIASYALTALLSAIRDWICIIITFRGGSLGPARMTALNAEPAFRFTGSGALTVFGPLTALDPVGVGNAFTISGVQARMGPFERQFLLGGWGGLVIGQDTPYRVDKVEGLEGWDVRTSDDDLPRGDGALRGTDLQAARRVLFSMNFGEGDERELEELRQVLFRALVPQRDGDLELIYRNPGEGLKLVRYRPTNLIRELTAEQALMTRQQFALLCADPRIYGAVERQATVPATPSGAAAVLVSAPNLGNGAAYPLIRVAGPTSGEPVTRVELRNTTNGSVFAVEAVLPRGATLTGDMEARATGANRSPVTIDGTSKYGAWVHPRQTFQLNPGANVLELRTVPADAPVAAEVIYRDTSSG
jgi:hypothetical protein